MRSLPTAFRTVRTPMRLQWRMLAAFALAASWCGSSYAIEVVAIEEHWELTVGEPDESRSGPQVCMVMSPTSDLDSDYFVFTLNHRSHPDYAPGGLQVQLWNGASLLDSRESLTDSALHHNNEVVRWVQRTELHGSSLTFEIRQGESSTWEDFGNDGHLKFTIGAHIHNLNGYRPAVSLGESGVSFAGNRVRSLVLTKLRWWDSEGNVYEMDAPIDIDADLDP